MSTDNDTDVHSYNAGSNEYVRRERSVRIVLRDGRCAVTAQDATARVTPASASTTGRLVGCAV